MQTSGPPATAGVGPGPGSRAGRSLPQSMNLFRALVDLGGHPIPLTCSQVGKAEGEVVIGGRPGRLD